MKTRSVVLGEIADTCLGKMLDQIKNKGEYQPYLANINVRWGSFDLENLPQMRFLNSEEERYGLKYGDILVCEGGEPGRCAIWKDQIPGMKFQKALHRVRVHEQDVDYRWLFYRFLYAKSRGEFDQYFSGTTTIKHMPGDKLVKIRIDLPERDYQSRVGDILSAYDNLIENNQKQIKLLEEAAQRLYKEWFVDLRFPGYENTPIVDGVPEGWTVRSIGDFGDVITGKTPSTAKKEYYGGAIPFVKIPDMHGCVYPIKTESTLTDAGAKTQTNKYIPRNSIMVSCIATVGLVNLAVEKCQTNQQINSIVPADEKDVYFLYSAMKRIKELLEGVGSNGATMTNVNKTKFANLSVLYPTEELRNLYYDFCNPVFAKIYCLSRNIVNLINARDRLLPKLMSGEMEV